MGSERLGWAEMLRRLLVWWLGLSVTAVGALYLSSGGLAALQSPWGLADILLSRLGFIFPFVTFAAGLGGAAAGVVARRYTFAVLLVTGSGVVVAYFAGEVFAPIAEHRRAVAAGDELSSKYPFGPHTPTSLARMRAFAEASPPEVFGYSVNRPLEMPPNWIMYQIHSGIAIALFGLLNGPLGLMFGWVTTGLSPPSRRRHVRWAGGLVSAVAYFVVFLIGFQWVRASPENSALLGAWLPLVVPAVACVALAVLMARGGALHTSADSGV